MPGHPVPPERVVEFSRRSNVCRAQVLPRLLWPQHLNVTRAAVKAKETGDGASTGGLSSVALPAPYGVAISPQRTSLRGDVSPARPASRGARSSNNTYSSQHTSPASSPTVTECAGAAGAREAQLLFYAVSR